MANRADRHEQWAIFWCSLLQPLLIGEIPPEEAADFLRELTETEHLLPGRTTQEAESSHPLSKVEAISRRRFRGVVAAAT